MPASIRNPLLTALLALVFGFLGAAIWSYAGLADNRTREYLLANPRMLQDMAEALQAEQARERLAELGEEVYEPFPGAVLGNPDGTKVLVEFSDYNCGYCEASLADVSRLIESDPEVKVVLREMPQFEGSEAAARMALAAALQGKYADFHNAMFARGPAGPDTAEAVARDIGLDMERARADIASDAVSVELARNFSLARALGFSGTPAFVTGDRTISGAVGYEALSEAVAEAGALTEG
ncbi:DsbA family protein [Erythrobacter sp. HL-111]|uniref:DsbA family protein n=1 Tax=Erythrobacter sp. HL-111 TaxID=1798193 RepID=UPI0006DACD93|nr:DsbA family protein [Erythrobacter sp. HL-111]KPP85848.1 MAG: Protein-disulfide isomerase [Erythrobacteraceae bacterium HL-111]SDS79410.1 Thioredoxin [Erythrobacter sp. HL-111]